MALSYPGVPAGRSPVSSMTYRRLLIAAGAVFYVLFVIFGPGIGIIAASDLNGHGIDSRLLAGAWSAEWVVASYWLGRRLLVHCRERREERQVDKILLQFRPRV